MLAVTALCFGLILSDMHIGRAREMAQLTKCLSSKHENLNSISAPHVKCGHGPSCYLSTREVETEGSWALRPMILADLVHSMFNKRPYLKQ